MMNEFAFFKKKFKEIIHFLISINSFSEIFSKMWNSVLFNIISKIEAE